MDKAQKYLYIAAGVLAVGAVVYVWMRGVKGAAQDVAKAAVDVATGTASGVVQGVGSAVGIPQTDAEKCQDALKRGDRWDASFYCDAGTFISSINPFGNSTVH